MSRATAAGALARSLVALAAALAAPAWAADAPLASDGVQLRGDLRVGIVLFDYAETYQGRTLDREEGVLPSVSGEAEVRWRWALGRFALRYAGGSVSYSGEVQAPSTPSLDGVWARGTSDAQQLELRLEAGGFVDEARRLALLAGGSARLWIRSIQDTTATARDGTRYLVQGYSETYGWWEIAAGARAAILDGPADAWEAEAWVVRTVAPRLDVDYFGSTVSLDLGARFGWRVATSWRHAVAPAWFLVAGLWGEGYRFGASGVDPVVGILEPDSRTFRVGVEFGVGGRL